MIMVRVQTGCIFLLEFITVVLDVNNVTHVDYYSYWTPMECGDVYTNDDDYQ